MTRMADTHETVALGAGCFWQVEVEFRNTEGVKDAVVGYMGGDLDHPSYEQVCTDRTGHVEVCQVSFDPDEVSLEEILDVFWRIHDPTQLNRQGPDVGSQYRSAIFFATPEQERIAIASRERAQAGLRRPIVTEITPAGTFWPAEDYHQRYLEKRGLATCRI
jgi:peptide-methionine (S)-S-oxide reductase